MSYTAWSVVFGEQPSAAKWNQLGSNDASFNDGTGLPMAGSASSVVATSETTTSTSYTGLTTPQTATVTVGNTGMILIGYNCTASNSGANNTRVAYALSGANTYASTDNDAVLFSSGIATVPNGYGRTRLHTGLSTGSTVVTMQFKVAGGTGTFLNRVLWAIPL